jgi:hypothetical protein
MPSILAQIAPQRSTQYAELATALAPYELRLSTLGAQVGEIRPRTLGGLDYLQFELPAEPDATPALRAHRRCRRAALETDRDERPMGAAT